MAYISIFDVIGQVNARRLSKLGNMNLGSDWRRARRYARIGIALSRDAAALGGIPFPSEKTLATARKVARNGGK